MSSVADQLLAVGFVANLAIHGEALGYIPASAVNRSESGEAVVDHGTAILSDDTQTEITGIIDEDYIVAQAGDSQVVSTSPAAIVQASEVTGIERGAIIVRSSDEQVFYVQVVQAAQPDGSQVVLLSRHAH